MRRSRTSRPRAFARILAPALVCGCAALVVVAPAGAQDVPARRPPSRLATDVDADIAALKNFHEPAKEAGNRLVIRGDEILDRLHAALLSPDANDKQRIQLTTVLGEIGDPSSIGPMIALARAYPQQLGIRQEVVSMLTELPETPEARDFVASVLGDREESYLVRRKALVYFGRHRDAEARHWADEYRTDPEVELKTAALYLAARLGDETARQPIVDVLNLPAPPATRYALLLALAEVAGPDEFESLTPDWIRGSWEYRSGLRISRFRTAGREDRLRLTDEMIDSRSHVERQMAAAYILDERGPDALKSLLRRAPDIPIRSAARNQLRRAGYRVLEAPDGELRLQRKDSER